MHSKEKSEFNNSKDGLILKAAICGFLAGDGSVQKRKEKDFYHYQLDFFPDDPIMEQTYLQQIKKVYNKTPSVKECKKFTAVRLTSKVVVEDLLKIATFETKTWSLPISLFSLKLAKIYWLKAFFSAEAYVNAKSIKIQTVNEKGMLSIRKILQGLQIESKYYTYSPRNNNWSTVYIIFINKKMDRKKFYLNVGFWHSRKENILRESLDL